MGAGRKTKTLTLKEKAQPSRTVNGNTLARNLSKRDLAAVIFGCKNHTIGECYSKLLFGLPAPHFAYVKNIRPGLPLFLFNYSDRKLYGIFEAAGPGKLDIDPYGWIDDGSDYTPFGAQVRVHIRMQCQPLLEDQFRPVIADNYFEQKLFWFELDQAQTRNLISLFSLSPVDATTSLTQYTARRNTVVNAEPTSDTRHVLDDVEAPVSKAVSTHSNLCDMQWGCARTYSSVVGSTNISHQQKTWSSLFKNSTATQTLKEDEDLKTRALEFNFPHSYQHNVEWESSSVTPFLEGESRNLEALPEDSDMRIYEEIHSGSESGRELSCSSFQETLFEAVVADTNQESDFKTVALYENLPRSDDFNMGWGSSRATPHDLDGESQPAEASTDDDVSKIYDQASRLKTNEHSYSSVDNHGKVTGCPFVMAEVQSEEGCFSEAQAVAAMKSSNSLPVVAKLVQEVEGLKAFQLRQVQKISNLEQELEASKVEIQQLKNRCHVLESGSPSSIGHVEEAVIKTCDEPRSKIDDFVLVVGGFNGCSWLSALDSYSPSQDRMKSLKPMTFVRSYASAATLYGELYVLGGVDGDMWHDTVESYNPKSDQWVSRPSLNQKKGSLAGASLYDKIYAVGGGNGVDCYSEVEMFDINIGRWITTQSMRQKRFAPAAVEIDGTIYVVGGYDGRNYLDSVERFDPREHSWTRIGNMNTRRGCHSLTVLNGKLYALGGYDGAKMVSTVEIFDPRLGSWMMGKPMNNVRGYSGAVVIGEKIYVIGGVKEGDEILGTIECYEEGHDWEVSNLKAVGKRCYFSAIVL